MTATVSDEAYGTTTAIGTRTATAGIAGNDVGILLSLNAAEIDGTIGYVGASSATGDSSVALQSPADVCAGDVPTYRVDVRSRAANRRSVTVDVTVTTTC